MADRRWYFVCAESSRQRAGTGARKLIGRLVAVLRAGECLIDNVVVDEGYAE